MKWYFFIIVISVVSLSLKGECHAKTHVSHHHKSHSKSRSHHEKQASHKSHKKERYQLVTYYKNGKKMHRYVDTRLPEKKTHTTTIASVDTAPVETSENELPPPIADENFGSHRVETSQFVGRDIQAPTVKEPEVFTEKNSELAVRAPNAAAAHEAMSAPNESHAEVQAEEETFDQGDQEALDRQPATASAVTTANGSEPQPPPPEIMSGY